MKKFFHISYYVVVILLSVITLTIMIAGITSYIRREPLNLFGYGIAPVGSESMEPDIKRGDFVLIDHNFNFEDVLVGDDIVFASQDRNGKLIFVVHRVREIGSEGQLYTYGINNSSPDKEPVYESNFFGKVTGVSSLFGFGKILSDFRTGIVLVLVILLISLLISQIVRYITNKKELKYQAELKEYKAQVLKEIEQEQIKEKNE